MFGFQTEDQTVPKSVTLYKAHFQPTFGFTLRHVIVYPPEATNTTRSSNPERCPQVSSGIVEPTSVVVVHTVHNGGAGDQAGLAQGDRILSINGHCVSNCPYDQVVNRIQCSGDCLSLMVVPAKSPLSVSPEPYSMKSNVWSSDASVNKSEHCMSMPYLYGRMDTNQPDCQTDRIEALMSEMVHKDAGLGMAPKPLTPRPPQMVQGLRGAFSYDNIHNYCPPPARNNRGPPPPYRPRPPCYHKHNSQMLYQSNDSLATRRYLGQKPAHPPPPPPAPPKPTMIVQFQDNNKHKPVEHLQSLPPTKITRAPLQPGRSVDNVLHGSYFGGKRGSLATLPEIKENLQIDLSSASNSPLSPPSLSPFKSGKVYVPKSLSFESGLQAVEFKSNQTQGGRGESERLQHLQKVSKLAKKFEDGPVDLVGPLKLYHAQTYKRELQRIASSNEASGVKRVKQAAHNFESSSSCSSVSPLRLSLASSSSEISGRYGSTTHQKRYESRSASAGHVASNYEHIVLQQLNERKNSRSVTCSPQRPDSANLARSSPDLSIPKSSSSRRTRPQSFLAAVTGDQQMGAETVGTNQTDSSMTTTELITRPNVTPRSSKKGSSKGHSGHRISRFINLFSSGAGSSGANPSSSISADQLVLAAPATKLTGTERAISADDILNDNSSEMCLRTTQSSPLSPYNCISCEGVTRQGPVHHSKSVLGAPKTDGHQWKKCWAIVHQDSHLYLSHQRPHKTLIDEERVLQVPNEATVVELGGSIVDIAYDIQSTVHKNQQQQVKAHVIRISTQEHVEHLIEVDSEQIMLQWIEALQKSATTSSQNDSDSMALIIKRYETKQKETRSPAQNKSSKRLPVKIGATASAPPTDSPSTAPAHQKAHSSRSSPPNIDNQSKAMKSSDEKGEGSTPNRARKWKKVGKSGSCPQTSHGPGGPAFGQNLEDCATSGDDDFVPLLVQLCVKVVEAHGLDNVGVYRIPGNTAAVNALCTSLDKGFEHVDFSDPRWKDVNVVSSLLKAFFRRLPEPMLTDKLYPMFIDANRQENHAKRMHKLRHLIHKLPKHNYECLRYLMSHLNRVVINSDVNKMEARNLALMFGPSLVRPSGDNMSAMVSHMSDQCKIVESLIIYADWLFDANKERPTPNKIATERSDEQMTSSFSDMSDLLRRVHKTEEDLEKTKDNIVRSLLNVRRGSRKGKEPPPIECTAPQHRSPRKRYNRAVKSQSDKPLLVERVFNGDYQERNIDAEIELRLKNQAAEGDTPTSPPAPSTSNEEKDQAIEQMRKHREENIYTARRIFIAGPNAGACTPPATLAGSPAGLGDSFSGLSPDASSPMPRMSVKHLNLNALDTTDILSPETREKIRKLKELGKLGGTTVEYLSSDDLPSSSTTSLRRTPPRTALDAASITSDYSTTSSTAGQSAAQLLNTSANGRMASSDYSSSPLTSTDSRVSGANALGLTQSTTSVESTESTSEAAPTPTAAPSSLLYDRKRLRHVQPAESTFLGSSPRRLPDESSECESSSRRLCRERAWYEDDDSAHSPIVTNPVVNVVRTASDKVNGVGPRILAKVPASAPQTPETGSGDLRPVSRISQKIKFRSKSASADKRKDIRRHTLSDMEQTTLRSVLFGSNTATTNIAHTKWTRSSRLKAWFKDSFRKSSPDLAGSDNATVAVV